MICELQSSRNGIHRAEYVVRRQSSVACIVQPSAPKLEARDLRTGHRKRRRRSGSSTGACWPAALCFCASGCREDSKGLTRFHLWSHAGAFRTLGMTELQAKIDSLLLGAESSFFLHRRGAGMSHLTYQVG